MLHPKTRQKTRRAALLFVIAALIATALSLAVPASGASTQSESTGTASARTVSRTFIYKGRLATRIHYYNVCGADQGEQTTTVRIRVVVSPPLRPTPASPDLPPAVGNENNALHLSIGSKSAATNLAPGFISLASALRFGATSPPMILQYWNLKLRRGTTLRGTLVQDHREEAAAINLLSAPAEVVPCQPQFGTYPNAFAIAEGAVIRGTVTKRRVRLTLSGTTIDGTRPWAARIAAER